MSGGYGDLATQKFNAYAMVDYQQYGGIQARDRPFAATYFIPAEGVNRTSSPRSRPTSTHPRASATRPATRPPGT